MKRRVIAIVVAIILVCFSVFIVGVVFITNRKECSNDDTTIAVTRSSDEDLCKYSEEAQNSGLISFLAKMRRTYEEVHPKGLRLQFSSGAGGSQAKNHPDYLVPSNIKKVTDSARQLLSELATLNSTVALLKPREQKGLAQAKHVLEHNFAEPYDGDYYSGDWMLGPNHFCTQYICKLPFYVGYAVSSIPQNASDILAIRNILAQFNKTIYQYMENMRLGVTRGMVRSVEECLAGIDAVKAKYLNIVRLNSSGILKEWFVQFMLTPAFYTNFDGRDREAEWHAKNGQSVSELMKEYLVKYLGEPLHEFIRFLKHDNIRYCVPSDISSGLASLPLDYVYYEGKKTNYKTLKLLPTGEKLDGSKAYSKMLSFYTATSITPEEVHQLGWKQLNILYPQVVDIAKNFTHKFNESLAITVFKNRINRRDEYFNKDPFPENESTVEAKERCQNIADAQTFCPERWKSIQLWFDEARKVMSQLDPKTSKMFYFTGTKHTAPNCPVEMNVNFNPSVAAQSYRRSDPFCSRPAQYKIPFFVDNHGPRYREMSVNAHEARPGHHTQRQGHYEHFKVFCSSDPLVWLDTLTSYQSFSEGWAMYAENPLVAQDTDIYSNNPLKKYGMLKGQIWRALRLIVDTGLHYKGMKRDEALELFSKYAWDNSDVAAKEITRYQSNPGQATSYMIGQLYFINLRKLVEVHLGDAFNLRDFHYQVLRHGSAPLSFLEDQIKKYVKCKKDSNSTGCEYLVENTTGKIRPSIENEMEKDEGELFSIRELIEAELYY